MGGWILLSIYCCGIPTVVLTSYFNHLLFYRIIHIRHRRLIVRSATRTLCRCIFKQCYTGCPKKVPSIEIRPFVVNCVVIPLGIYLCEIVLLYFRRVMLFCRSGSYNYSAIHVQVNSFPKGVTTHVKNKRSDFNRGYFFLGRPVQSVVKFGVELYRYRT